MEDSWANISPTHWGHQLTLTSQTSTVSLLCCSCSQYKSLTSLALVVLQSAGVLSVCHQVLLGNLHCNALSLCQAHADVLEPQFANDLRSDKA